MPRKAAGTAPPGSFSHNNIILYRADLAQNGFQKFHALLRHRGLQPGKLLGKQPQPSLLADDLRRVITVGVFQDTEIHGMKRTEGNRQMPASHQCLKPCLHLHGGSSRKGDDQDPFRSGAVFLYQFFDSVGNDQSFSRTGPRQYKSGAVFMADCHSLILIQFKHLISQCLSSRGRWSHPFR